MAVIEINNLGPINHCRMDLKKFCVLTGPQASGKSTIAKAIFFFRTIKDDCLSLYSREKLSGVENGDLSHSLKKYLRGKFMQMFGSSWSMSMDMCMFYQFGENTYINLSLKKSTYPGIQNYIEFAFSDDILQLLNSLNEKEYEREQVLKMLQNVFQDDFETVYIPAGRSLITLLTSQLNYILSAMDDGQKKSIDYCTQNYMERILRLKPLFSDGMREMYYNKLFTTTIPLKKDIITKLMETIDSILKGKYQYAGGEERLFVNDHQYVKLNYSSSGQQEVIWILNLLFYYVLENRKIYLILEEPESHLYPEAQSRVAEAMGLFLNAGNHMLVTTHSPYILGSINNLMYAGALSEQYPESVEKIIAKERQMHAEHTAAYYVQEGTLNNIMDDSEPLIQNSVIDGISMEINDQMDQLLQIDMGE